MDLADMRKRLQAAFDQETVVVSVEPSAITGSPHDYVYVYLTEAGAEGPHAIVSEAAEYDADDRDGLLVGTYAHHEEINRHHPAERVGTVDEAVARTVELVKQEAWK